MFTKLYKLGHSSCLWNCLHSSTTCEGCPYFLTNIEEQCKHDTANTWEIHTPYLRLFNRILKSNKEKTDGRKCWVHTYIALPVFSFMHKSWWYTVHADTECNLPMDIRVQLFERLNHFHHLLKSSSGRGWSNRLSNNVVNSKW